MPILKITAAGGYREVYMAVVMGGKHIAVAQAWDQRGTTTLDLTEVTEVEIYGERVRLKGGDVLMMQTRIAE